MKNDDKKTPPGKLPQNRGEKSVVEVLMDEMTLEEKVGQLLMVGMDGKELDEKTARFLQDHKVGGVILFERNMESSQQVGKLTEQLQELESGPAGVGMLIGTDQEGGRVNRLPGEKGRFPSARALAVDGRPDKVRDAAAQMADQLKQMGINMNFAPVLDINSNPRNPVIGDRAFGDNPEIVSKMGLAFIQGTLDEGIIPVAKHFPGHGDTLVDSHTELPIVEHSMERLNSFELVPFKEAIKNGVPAIMTAHILLPKLDEDAPATLSPSIVSGLLREQLQFDGVVVSDDLDMDAVAKLYSPGEAAVKAVKSGVDMLLICHRREGMSQAFDALIAAARSGDISMEKIDGAVLRVLTLKQKFGLIDR